MGRRRVIYLFKLFLPAVTCLECLEEGGPGQHPVGQPNNAGAGGLALLPGVNAAQRTLLRSVVEHGKDDRGLS